MGEYSGGNYSCKYIKQMFQVTLPSLFQSVIQMIVK